MIADDAPAARRCSSARWRPGGASARRRSARCCVAIGVSGRSRDRDRGGALAGRARADRGLESPFPSAMGRGPLPDLLEQPRAHGPASRPRAAARRRDRAPTRAARATTCAARSRGWSAELGELFAENFRRQGFEWRVGAAGGPRVLSLGELERIRDALAARLRDARVEIARRADVEEANRGLLEAMIAAPGAATAGCGSPTRTSASRAACTGTRARAGASSGCSSAGGGSSSPRVVR